jgi:hypothetical protein
MIIKLQKNYEDSFEQFQVYSEMYGIAKRLGFKSELEAWQENPYIQVTTNPADLRVVKKDKKKKRR